MLYDRLDLLLARAVAQEAHAQNLPLAVHTGDARDVTDAVDIGANSIEHGSLRDEIPDSVLARMAQSGIYYDPTLDVAEAYANYYGGRTDSLNKSLVQQTVARQSLEGDARFSIRRKIPGRGQGTAIRTRLRSGAGQPAARLESRRAAGHGHRFGQPDGLSRPFNAPRVAALGACGNSSRSRAAGRYV